MTFVVAVSKQWLLDQKVSRDATETDIAIVNELVSTIRDVAPWVDLPTLNKGARAMTLDAPLKEVPDVVPIRMSEFLAGFVGNPPGQDILVQPSAGGAVVFADTALDHRAQGVGRAEVRPVHGAGRLGGGVRSRRPPRQALRLDATSDMKALNANDATRDDTILIEFVRTPGNDATEDAMLRVLFGDSSPIQALKLANGDWIERAAWRSAN